MKEFIIGFLIAVGILFFLLVIILYLHKKNIKKSTVVVTDSKTTTTTTTTTPPPPSTKKKRDWWKILKNVLWTLLILFLIVLIGLCIVWLYNKITEPKPKADTEIIIPDPIYEDDYQLEKGKDIVIYIKANYHYGYDGYGIKYYRQSFYENGEIGPKELIGGGIPLKHNGKGSIKVVKVILSVYEEEGRVTVYHSKDLKQLLLSKK